jgi:hypothetical protein
VEKNSKIKTFNHSPFILPIEMMNTIYFFNNEEIPKSTYYRKLKLYPSQCRKERCEDKRYESFEQSSPNESEEENVQNSDEMVSFDSSDECGSYIYSSDECDDDNPINIGGDLDFDSNYYGDNDQDVMEEEIEEEEEKIPNKKYTEVDLKSYEYYFIDFGKSGKLLDMGDPNIEKDYKEVYDHLLDLVDEYPEDVGLKNLSEVMLTHIRKFDL